MPDTNQCPDCGAPIPPGQPKGLCATSALKGALELSNEHTESVSTSPPTPEAGERIGRYKLLEKIGEGGCGVVYMAEQEEPVRRRVALKVIKPGMDTREVIARFEAERQALALMEHPHIAKVFDGGATDAGRPYFVMELVRGLRITDYCDQKNLPTRLRLDLFMQVCQAVQHAHQKGIIHRDLKPSNILLTVNDGVPVPKVIDFGIAKATGQRLTDKTLFTKFHQFLGTPAYISPEQAEMTSVDIDTRSDIYSLGVLLYELLTGRTPFDTKELLRAGMESMLRTIREREPVRPSARLSTLAANEQTTVAQQRQTDAPKLINLVRGDLDWIVMKCLEKDRARRYETANGLALDLQRHLDQEPVLARPPTTTYRMRKFVRRNKLAVSAVTLVVATVFAGFSTSTLLFVKERNARHRATTAELEQTRLRREAQQAQETEATLRKQAEGASIQLACALNQLELESAEKLFEGNNSHRGFAYLARILRRNPTNSVAAQRLMAALSQRDLLLPISEPLRQEATVEYAEFSRDGRRLLTLTVSDARTAQVWNPDDGQPISKAMRHEGDISCGHFSPDGQKIVTGSHKIARIWDANTGEPLVDLLGHDGFVTCVQFSPDGERVLTSSDDVRVWDASSGRPLTKTLQHGAFVFAEFSPDGKRIVAATQNRAVRVFNAATGEAMTDSLPYGGGVPFAHFNWDGTMIVAGSSSMTAQVLDSLSGQPIGKRIEDDHGNTSTRFAAEFSLDGLRLATAGLRSARIWDVRTGEAITELLRHGGKVNSAKFSPEGFRLVTASSDGTAQLWDAHSGKPIADAVRHGDEVHCAQFSPDGLCLVTTSDDKTARLWDVNLVQAEPITLRHSSDVVMARFSPDGNHIVTASWDGTACLWDAHTGKRLTAPAKRSRCFRIGSLARVFRAKAAAYQKCVKRRVYTMGQMVLCRPQPTHYLAVLDTDGSRIHSTADRRKHAGEPSRGDPSQSPKRRGFRSFGPANPRSKRQRQSAPSGRS